MRWQNPIYFKKLSKAFIFGFLALIMMGALVAFPASNAKAVEIGYSEGFEDNNGGFTPSGIWQWGTPTSGPGSAHSGTKCWATNLSGDVPKGTNAYLTSAAIPVRAITASEIARVRFYGWIQIDEMYDRGEFQVSADGSSWKTMAEFFYIMQGDWTEYYFDISDYAGGNVFLRFRLYADTRDAFWIELGGPPPYSSVNMAGWYIDDLAIEITEKPATETTLTLEGFEDQSAYASCPWVYTWDGTEFVKDNDIYSTARGTDKEFRDYYNLSQPLTLKDGQYLLELRETEEEYSYTDFVNLITADHAAGVNAAADDNGQVWTYGTPSLPDSALDSEGNDVLAGIAAEDGVGFNAFNDDYVTLDFGSLDTAAGATLVLNVQGFQESAAGAGEPTGVRPWVHIQTQDADGSWVTRNEFYPRWEPSTCAYDLSEYLGASKQVRLYATSCHAGKYQLIDYAGLDTSAQAPVTVTTLPAASALKNGLEDVSADLGTADNVYTMMSPGENIALAFDAPELAEGQQRDFVFVTEGYYIPSGTFFIYTWDGEEWQQRDGWSQEGYSDQTKSFDLSAWLPDPDGEYKVRIWQDYWYNQARIDYVGLSQGGVSGTLARAEDLRNTANRAATGPVPWDATRVKNAVQASDNSYINYPTESASDYYYGTRGYPQRDRWLEAEWTGLIVNNPPNVSPVTITDPTSNTPTISWTYSDTDSDPQVQYEVEVWTGPAGTGLNVWDPAVFNGAEASAVYTGSELVGGETYYARVMAYDGTTWGPWAEASWTAPSNQPPVADAGPDQTIEQTSLDGADVTLDGSATADDGSLQPVTYEWAWEGGSASGVNPVVTLPLGATTVTLTVNDGQFTATDEVTITVVDTTAPTLDIPADITVEQSNLDGAPADVPAPQVSDICDADPVVVIDGLMDVYPLGDTVITVTATDFSGNTAQGTIVVHVVDTTAPEVSIDNLADGQEIWAGETIDVQYTVNDICDATPVVTVTPADTLNPPLNVGSLTITVTAQDASGNTGSASVTVEITPVPATINFDPDTFNIGAGGQWATAYIEMPAGYDVHDIDGSTVMLNGQIPACLDKQGWAKADANDSNIMDHDGDGIPERMVKFDRAAVEAILAVDDEVQITVTGKLAGADFEGFDIIRVIQEGTNKVKTNNGKKK